MDDIIILAMLPKQNQKETIQLTAIARDVQSFFYIKAPDRLLEKLNTLSFKFTTKKGCALMSWMKDKVQSQQVLEQLVSLVMVQTPQGFSAKQRYQPLIDKIKDLNDLKKQEKRFEQMLGNFSFNSQHLSLQQKMNQFVYSMATSQLLLNFVVSEKGAQFPTEKLSKSTPNIQKYGESLWKKMEQEKQKKKTKQQQISNIEKNFVMAKLDFRIYSLTQNFKKIKEYYDQKLKKHCDQYLMIKQSQFNLQLTYIKGYLSNIVSAKISEKDYLQKIADPQLKKRLSNYSQLLLSKCPKEIEQIRQSLKCSVQKQKRQLLHSQRKAKQLQNDKQKMQLEKNPYKQVSLEQAEQISRLKDRILHLEELNYKLQAELKSTNARNNNQTQRFNGAKYQRTDSDYTSKQKISDLGGQVSRLLQLDLSNKEKIEKNQLYRAQTTAKITQLQMSNQNQKQELDSLNNEIIQNEKKIKRLLKEILDKEAHIQIFKLQCQKLKNRIKDCLEQKQRLADSLQKRVEVEKGERSKQVEFQSSLLTLKQSLLEKNGTVKNMSEQLLLLQSECDSWKAKYQQCLSELESAKLTATKNIESVNVLQNQLEERRQKEKERMDRQSIEQKNMRLALKQVTDKKQELQREVNDLKVKNQSNKQKLMARIKQLQMQKNEQISAVKRENNSLQQELLELQQKYNEQVQRNDVPFKNNEYEEWKKKLAQKQKQNEDLLNEFNISRKELQVVKLQMQAQNVNFVSEIQKWQSKTVKINESFQKLKEEQKYMVTVLKEVRESNLFQNQILEEKSSEKHRLIENVEKFQVKKLFKTKLLYNFDLLNSTDIHKYVDGKERFLCLIKTAKATIAAYYPGVLRRGVLMIQRGLLISLADNEGSQMLQQNGLNIAIFQGMIFDSFFLVFGKFDLRIGIGNRTVSGRFGKNSEFLGNRDKKMADLLNKDEKFEKFQCYQLFFKEE